MGRETTGRVIFSTSAAIILYEITLSRIFSVLMWYHFVSFAVALALCGMAAGSLLAVNTGKKSAGESATFVARCLFFGFFSVLAVYLLLCAMSRVPSFGYRILSPLHQTYYEPFAPAGGKAGLPFLATVISILIVLSFPFVGGGAVFAACFERSRSDFRTYFWAMAGSGAGVILYLAGLKSGSGPFAFLLASFLYLGTVAFLFRSVSRKTIYLFSVLMVMTFLLMGADLLRQPAEPRFVRGRYAPEMLWSRWNAVSRVAVYPITPQELKKAFEQGKYYRGKPPRGLGMVVDDTVHSIIFGDQGSQGFDEFFSYNISSLPYLLKGGGEGLIIGTGGGKEIHGALSSGDVTVDAVEMNSLVVKAVQEVFGDFSMRPYTREGVTLHVKEGRSYLEGNVKRYDVIQMTQIFGRVPPQAGAFTLTENHLYTTEAINRMLEMLRKGGVLSVTRFSFERIGPRLVNTIRHAIHQSGWGDPAEHMLVAGSKGAMNVLAVKGGVNQDLADRFNKLCADKGFDILYAPSGESRGLIGKIVRGKGDLSGLAYDTSPPTDDRPFFHYTVLPGDFLKGNLSSGGSTEDRGALLVRKFLQISLILSLLLPFGASSVSGAGKPHRKLPAFFAFLLTGAGFITVEIILIKKLILPLGFPVYSLSCILLSVFLFSGAGAGLFSLLLLREKHKVFISSLSLVVILMLYRYGIDGLVYDLVGLSDPAKFLACFLLAGLPGFFLGIPFPGLLIIYNRKYGGSKSVPVAVNGFASVTGSMLALAVSMNLGYSAALLFAGGIYALVAILSLVA